MAADLEPCFGDSDVDVDDILMVLDAYAGLPDTCPEVPNCPSRSYEPMAFGINPGSSNSQPIEGVIHLVASESDIMPGSTWTVNVLVEGIPYLRAYELALDVSGGTSGSLAPMSLAIDSTAPGFVFSELKEDEYEKAVDRNKWRLVAAKRIGSVDASELRYLASFVFRVSPEAAGTFGIVLREADTHLRDTYRGVIKYRNDPLLGVSLRIRTSAREGRLGKADQ